MADSPELARARDVLSVSADEHARVDALSSAASASLSTAATHLSPSFFEGFALRGIRVLRLHPGFIHCSYTVPPSLTVRHSLPSSISPVCLIPAEVNTHARRTPPPAASPPVPSWPWSTRSAPPPPSPKAKTSRSPSTCPSPSLISPRPARGTG
uniref:Uncharacterized protein n=1 Tax=Aegilops tauschii subsp. strangulata TaxID=200361 RepID=A0A453HSB6_AEGTS